MAERERVQSDQDKARREVAEHRASLAVVYLLREHPFFGGVMTQIEKRYSPHLPPTCYAQITLTQSGKLILDYGPVFANENFSISDLAGIFYHEILHVIMNHFNRLTNIKDEDIPRKLVAADLAINPLIPPNLRPPGILFPHMFDLPEGKTMEEYFELLKNNTKFNPVDIFRVEGNITEIAIERVKTILEKAKEWGEVPLGLKDCIDEIIHPYIPIERYLRQYCGMYYRSPKHSYTWKRINRRFDEEQPGKIRQPSFHIITAIDTSGSISVEELQHFLGILLRIRNSFKGCKLTVIECDADVQDVYEIRGTRDIKKEVSGRGGTDYEPVFRYIVEHKLTPDVLVYLTDGYAPKNLKKPPYPVIWVSTGDLRFPFGTVIQYDLSKERKA